MISVLAGSKHKNNTPGIYMPEQMAAASGFYGFKLIRPIPSFFLNLDFWYRAPLKGVSTARTET
jgi:hypothetical protein